MAERISLDFTRRGHTSHATSAAQPHVATARAKVGEVKLLVLDILKPHRPSVLEYAQELSKIDPSYSINIRVIEINERTETCEAVIEGSAIDFKRVEDTVLALGGSIQSMDEVCVGAKLIDSRK